MIAGKDKKTEKQVDQLQEDIDNIHRAMYNLSETAKVLGKKGFTRIEELADQVDDTFYKTVTKDLDELEEYTQRRNWRF